MIQDKKDYVHKDAYDLLWEKCEKLEKELSSKNNVLTMINMEMKEKIQRQDKTINRLFNDQKNNANSRSVFKLEREISRLRSIIMRLYDEQNTIGDRYVFSNIPNDDLGQNFIQMMKLYLNNKSYIMRKKGQYLDKDKLSEGESWRNYTYGQPLGKSKCFRLYIDKKKQEKA
tara:strand:+ start:848 stop:1363 length:516 start_codon:yes stop_codon:yes gene_type:complete